MPDSEDFRPVRDLLPKNEPNPAVDAAIERLENNRAQAEQDNNYPAMSEAIRLSGLGFSILPVLTNKKDPTTAEWERATRAYPQTFLRNPGTRNYGILPPPGCVILDVDKDCPALIAMLADTLGPLPITRTHASPNGLHVILRWPDDLPRPSGLWWGKVYARWPLGDKGQGYVVGPGSEVTQPDGTTKKYMVYVDEDIATLPVIWAESVLAYRPPRPTSVPEGLEWDEQDRPHYELPDVVGEGGRYHSMVQYTASLYNQGLSTAEMWDAVKENLLPRWSSLKSPNEMRGDFVRATKGMEARLGPRAHVDVGGSGGMFDSASVPPTSVPPTSDLPPTPEVGGPDTDPPLDSTEHAQAEAQATPPEHASHETPAEPPLLERADLLLDRLNALGPVPYLLDHLVVASGLNLVGGHPKSGKSLAILQMQAAVVTGEDFLGHDALVRGHRVCGYITQEGSRHEMATRLDRLGAAYPTLLTSGRFRVAYLKPLLFTKDGYAAVSAALADIESEFSSLPGPLDVWLALDPLRDFMPGGSDENEAKSMAVVKAWCRTLLSAFPFLTITLAHHLRKQTSGDTGLELSGSGATYAMVDSTIVWKAKKRDETESEDGSLFVRRPLKGSYHVEGRGSEPGQGRWRYDDGSGLIVLDTERQTDSRGRSTTGETHDRVYGWLVDAGSAGLTASEVVELSGDGLSPDAARAALRRLVNVGRAVQVGGAPGRGGAARYYRPGYNPASAPDGLMPEPSDDDEDFTADPLHSV